MNPPFTTTRNTPVCLHATRGFTIIELLFTMAIMLVLMAMAGNILRTDTRRADVNTAIDNFSGVLQEARWEARSKSTFVWVCLKPVTDGTGGGVQVALFGSRDGTADATSTNLIEIGRRRFLKQVSVRDANTTTPERLRDDYEAASVDPLSAQRLGGSTAVIGGGPNTYSDLIFCFNPRGEASIPGKTAAGFIEILFAPHVEGTESDAKSSSILLSHSTGLAQVYR